MEFDPTFTVSNAFAVVNLLIAVGAMAFTWIRTRRSDVENQFKAGSKRMGETEKRLQSVEEKLQTMPDKDDMHSLQLTLSEMNGEMKATRATMRSIAESQTRLEHSVTRHEDYLRENK